MYPFCLKSLKTKYFVLNFLSIFWNLASSLFCGMSLFWWLRICIFFSWTRKRASGNEYRIFSPSFSPNLDLLKRFWASAVFDVILSEIRVAFIILFIWDDWL